MTFSVNPTDLQDSSRLAAHSAREVQSLPGELGRLFRLAGEAAGCPEVASAGQAAARRWQPATEGLAREAQALARGVGTAGVEYAVTEGAQASRFGAGG